VTLIQGDFNSLWELGYLDELDGGSRLDQVLSNVRRQRYDDDPIARLFACVGTEKFFKNLIRSVIFQNGLLFFGRIEMLLCVPPPVFFVSSLTNFY
jgi:hypothetical protein